MRTRVSEEKNQMVRRVTCLIVVAAISISSLLFASCGLPMALGEAIDSSMRWDVVVRKDRELFREHLKNQEYAEAFFYFRNIKVKAETCSAKTSYLGIVRKLKFSVQKKELPEGEEEKEKTDVPAEDAEKTPPDSPNKTRTVK